MPAAQPFAAHADALDGVVPELDALIRDLRLGNFYGRPDVQVEDARDRAQEIATAIMAPFKRAPRQVCPPIGRIGSAVVY